MVLKIPGVLMLLVYQGKYELYSVNAGVIDLDKA
jgi:hypothetical protein